MKLSKSTGSMTATRSGSRRRGASSAAASKRDGTASELLIEGETCWRRAHAARAAVLIDAASYFEALRASLLAAERTIFILGWELHSRMQLTGRARPRDGAPLELGKLLRWLLKRKPHLTIRILLWNHPVLWSIQRELFPRLIFGTRRPERVEILLDSHLPVGASHHEKLVIVDDHVAYCGGVDLTQRRWDTAAHHPAEPRRRDLGRKPYVPMHDVQIVVEGEAAAALGERARERWQHAGGKPVPVDGTPLGNDAAWPPHVEPDFEDSSVGIMRTVAALEERDQDIREVERSTVAALESAERLIYIENQYVTSKTACDALAARMRANPALEAIVVTTREPGGFLEAEIMGVGRQHFMAAFADSPLASRIQFVAPMAHCDAGIDEDESKVAPDGVLSIHVHAKVLIVDDRFVRIGSSNLNNRSMGFDTECDLAIEAVNDAQRRAIASIRNRLIAEHWGSDEQHVAAALDSGVPAAKALRAAPRVPVFSTAHGARHQRLMPWRRAARAPAFRAVRPIERAESAGIDLVVQLGDPERVVSAEQLVAQATGIRNPSPLVKWALALLGIAALVGLLLFAMSRIDLGFGDVGRGVVAVIEGLAGNPWRVPLVLATFVAASVVAVPILALIGATVVALGPVLGFFVSAVGTLLAASATFGVGRLVGRKPLQRVLGARIDALEKRIAKRGVIAIALIRKVPIAPFTFVNMAIGALGIRFRDFLLGTALGMLPGIAAFAFVSESVIEAWHEPTPRNLAAIAGAIAVWLAVLFGIQHLLNRHASR
jgi:phosphatidylserine/phosphatidylglycerophosphate/cardiolipin synthase-like enzyme/uncharacterized membrane protein YdjX (TVP38/TMEM64 family)